jgi:hypothetical protein
MTKFKDIELNAVNSNALLDKALKLTHLKNDAALSRALEVAPPVLSKIRHGRLPVGATLLIALHEITGMSIAEMKDILNDEVSV